MRFKAIVALSVPADDEPDQGPVVDALLEVLHDPSPEVRNWATFALGVQRDVDTPPVRDALMAMLTDDDNGADTAGEAAVALAKRADPRIFEPLLARLSDPEVGNLWVEAAVELADPRLVPALERLKAAGWKDDDPRPEVLDEAIVRCSGQSRDDSD